MRELFHSGSAFTINGLKSLSYTERLLRLNLESLEFRRVKADLVLLFKVIHGFVDIDYSAMFAGP